MNAYHFAAPEDRTENEHKAYRAARWDTALDIFTPHEK